MSYLYDLLFFDRTCENEWPQRVSQKYDAIARAINYTMAHFREKNNILVVCDTNRQMKHLKHSMSSQRNHFYKIHKDHAFFVHKSKTHTVVSVGTRTVNIRFTLRSQEMPWDDPCDIFVHIFPTKTNDEVFFRHIVPFMNAKKTSNILVCTEEKDKIWVETKAIQCSLANGHVRKHSLPESFISDSYRRPGFIYFYDNIPSDRGNRSEFLELLSALGAEYSQETMRTLTIE